MEILSESNNNSTTGTEFTFSRTELDSTHENQMNGGNNYSVNTYSEESTLSVNTFNQNGGGLFCSDEFNDILLEAFCDVRPDIVCYLLCKTKKLPKDLVKKDTTGKNILHYMSIYASHGNMVLHITRLVRKGPKSSLKKALKMQDELGNTPLHYAAALGFNNLVKLFIDNGADPKIKNNDGVYIEEDNDVNEIEAIILSEDCTDSKRLEALNDYNTLAETLSIISRDNDVDNNTRINYVFTPTEQYDTEHFMKELEKQLTKMEPEEIRQSAQRQSAQRQSAQRQSAQRQSNKDDLETVETEEIINNILNKSRLVEQQDVVNNMSTNNQSKRLSENTDALVDNILNRISSPSNSKALKGGYNNLENNNIDSESILTENILNAIIEKQSGGKKSSKNRKSKKDKKSKISRIDRDNLVSTYSEVSEISVNPIDSDASDISDIARQISRQSSDIHERSVDKIIELLKLDKTKPDDVQKARNYKAAIYKMIKEKNPLLNNFDRAVEMEKAITKEMLKSIDIDKVTKEIEKHMSEKSKSDSESVKSISTLTPTTTAKSEKSEKKTKKDKVDTPTKKSKATQKRIPEFKHHLVNNNFSLTSPISNVSDTLETSSSSESYSAVSEF